MDQQSHTSEAAIEADADVSVAYSSEEYTEEELRLMRECWNGIFQSLVQHSVKTEEDGELERKQKQGFAEICSLVQEHTDLLNGISSPVEEDEAKRETHLKRMKSYIKYLAILKGPSRITVTGEAPSVRLTTTQSRKLAAHILTSGLHQDYILTHDMYRHIRASNMLNVGVWQTRPSQSYSGIYRSLAPERNDNEENIEGSSKPNTKMSEYERGLLSKGP